MTADITAEEFSIAAFKQTTNAWFGSPEALALMQDGNLTGHFQVGYLAGAPVWSGQAQLSQATLNIPGLAVPVDHLQGKATFDENTFDLPRMSGKLADSSFTGSYRYSVSAKHPQHLRVEFPTEDLTTLEATLAPSLADQGLLSHLPFTRRSVPVWLANRNIEGDISIAKCTVNQTPVGNCYTHFIWQALTVQLTDVQVASPTAKLDAVGTIALAARLPHYHLAMKVDNYPWSGGTLKLSGNIDTSGLGLATIQSVHAAGDFLGEDLNFPGSDPLNSVAGHFTFAFNGTSPVLKLSNVEARENDAIWSGEGLTNSEGKLLLDLTSGDRQLHLAADLAPPANVP